MGRAQFTRRNESYAEERAREGDVRSLDVKESGANNADPSSLGGTTYTVEDKDGSQGDEAVESIQTSAHGFPTYNGNVYVQCNDTEFGDTIWQVSTNPGAPVNLSPPLPYPEGYVIRIRFESFTGSSETFSATVNIV